MPPTSNKACTARQMTNHHNTYCTSQSRTSWKRTGYAICYFIWIINYALTSLLKSGLKWHAKSNIFFSTHYTNRHQTYFNIDWLILVKPNVNNSLSSFCQKHTFSYLSLSLSLSLHVCVSIYCKSQYVIIPHTIKYAIALNKR